MSDTAGKLGALSDDVKSSWHRFLDVFEPRRPELYRYCRSLTHSPWDAEDRGGVAPEFLAGYRPSPPRCEVRAYRDGFVLVFWYEHDDGPRVRSVMELATEAGSIVELKNYFFSPDVIAEVCRELGLPFRVNGYRYWLEGKP